MFEHPFTEDPHNEDNIIEVDVRPPIVICLSSIFARLVLAWDDIWDYPNWVLNKAILSDPTSSVLVF